MVGSCKALSTCFIMNATFVFSTRESETESCTFCLTVFSEAYPVFYSLDLKEKETIADSVLCGLCATYAVT